MTTTRRRFLGQLGTAAAVALAHPALAHARRGNPACRIVRPGDPDYDSARADFNARFSLHPRAILYACSARDVADGIAWARRNDVPIRARGGGHSYEAYSLVDDGLVIDTSPLDTVRVHARNGTATIGAGATLIDVYAGLWDQARVAIAGGSCASVGITGLTLGGGFGLLSRQLGLTCDALVEAEMVTADGDIVRASDREHADLFWALRGGGGGNFGIVTELVFRTHAVADVSLCNLSRRFSDLPAALRAWQAWAPGLDRRLVSVLMLPQAPQSVGLFCQLNGGPDELRGLVQPLVAAGFALSSPPRALPFIDAVRELGAPLGLLTGAGLSVGISASDAVKFKNSSGYAAAPLPDAAIARLVAELEAAPGPNNFVQLDSYGGAIADIDPRATAFAHRAAQFSLQYSAYWNDDADAARNIRWIRGVRRALAPFTVGAYVNYVDGDIADWPAAYYSVNLPRLRRVKRDWDRANVFRFAQSIPPL
jgi:FAD/FMN-containing dehydrogenase